MGSVCLYVCNAWKKTQRNLVGGGGTIVVDFVVDMIVEWEFHLSRVSLS
jgi:hypothetical protein